MVRHFTQAALLPLALACLVASSPECADGDTACQAEDASLMQLRPDRKAAHSAAQLDAQEGKLKCPRGRLPAVLGALDGNRFNLQYDEYKPLDVPPGSTLVLLLCNVGNSKGTRPELASSALVKEVGAGAKVYVLVEDSFNVNSKGDMDVVVGPLPSKETHDFVVNETARLQQALDQRKAFVQELDGQCPPRVNPFPVLQELSHHVQRDDKAGVKGPQEDHDLKEDEKEKQQAQRRQSQRQRLGDLRQLDQQQRQGSLVPPVVAGPIGSGAIVQVTVSGSGNVKTSKGSVTVNDAALLGDLVSTTGAMPGTKLQTRVVQSGNVHADCGTVTIAGLGSLLSTIVNGSDFSHTDVDVHVEGSARVWADDLVFVGQQARLMESALLGTGESRAEDAEVGVTLVQVVTFEGERLIRVDQEARGDSQPAVADIISLPDTLRFKYNVYVVSSWNFQLRGRSRSAGDILGKGYLMDRLMDMGTLESSEVQVTMLASANLEAEAFAPEAFSLLWIEELIALAGMNTSDVNLVVGGSANLNIDLLEPVDGAFIRIPVQVNQAFDPIVACKVYVTIDDSANWQGKFLNTNHSNFFNSFEVIDSGVDVNPDAIHSQMRVSMTRSANLRGDDKGRGAGSTVCLGSELIQEGLEADDLEDSVVEVTLRDTACIRATRVEVFMEDVVDEATEVDDLNKTKVKVVLDGVANIDADVVVLGTFVEVIEVVLDTDDLLDVGTSIVVSVSNSANVRAKQLTMSSTNELLEDVLQAEFEANASVKIAVTRSANAHAVSNITGDSGFGGTHLLQHVVDPSGSARNIAGVSIVLAETANVGPKSTLNQESFLLGEVIDLTPDLSLIKSLSMFATAVAGDTVTFLGGSAPCETPDILAEFAVPFAHSCVPLS